MPTPSTPAARRAFTLVELLISLGIALLLIYGINLVFRAVTDTVRVGNALAVATRKMRSIDSTLTLDFDGTAVELNPSGNVAKNTPKGDTDQRWSGLVPVANDIIANDPAAPADQQPKQPAITIYCHRTYAFMSPADRAAGPDAFQPHLLDEDESGTATDFSLPAQNARLNSRVHRTDTIGFFAGGSYVPRAAVVGADRKEGSGVGLQAWVWYGHVLQHNRPELTVPNATNLFATLSPFKPGGTGAFVQPGVGDPGEAAFPGGPLPSNPRNYYASDWVLGRMAITLVPRVQSTTLFPGRPALGLPNSQYLRQVFAEKKDGTSPKGSPALIDFNAEEVIVAEPTIAGSAPSNFSPSPTDINPVTDYSQNSAMPNDASVNAPVPFTSGLNDVAAVWPNLQAFGQTLLPTGDVGALVGGNFAPASFRGLVRRYQDLSATAWWKRSMVQGGFPAASAAPTAALSAPASLVTSFHPMRFNAVAAFSRPIDLPKPGVDILTPDMKSAMQATYLAKGCTQFIVEFAGDFCSQTPSGGFVTAGPDGIIDFRVVTVGSVAPITRRETRWYGLPRDVDGDGVADVERVGDLTGTPQSFEKYDDPESYVVAFGPNELYKAGPPEGAVRPWLIRLTVNLNDAASHLGAGLQREFVFKVR